VEGRGKSRGGCNEIMYKTFVGIVVQRASSQLTDTIITITATTSTSTSIRHQRLLSFSRCLAGPLQARLDYGNFVFVGLPVYLQRRLQAVLNAAARPVFRLRRYDHVTDALAILHWLGVPERVNFKLALMAYRVLNGMAPSYLNQLVPVSSLTGRRRLRSSFTLQLLVPSYRLSTVSRRSFPVAASKFWNTLPDDIQSASSVSAFC